MYGYYFIDQFIMKTMTNCNNFSAFSILYVYTYIFIQLVIYPTFVHSLGSRKPTNVNRKPEVRCDELLLSLNIITSRDRIPIIITRQ